MISNIIAKILLDSITDGGSRLTTWELTYPRMIHAELMTHRAFSRNAASSRAIPAAKLRERVAANPAIPISWGANQRGMQAGDEIADTEAARAWWLRGRDLMLAHHAEGEALGLHKQIVNRVIEPWMMITVICSMTDHANFYALRNHDAAEPNFHRLAREMWDVFSTSMPRYLAPGEWHTPMGDDVDPLDVELRRKVSTGRLARVSYLTHDGRRDHAEDVRLHDDLAATASMGADPMHASPFEHVAEAVGGRRRCANFEGWAQYRGCFPRENGPDTSERCERCGLWAGAHVSGCRY